MGGLAILFFSATFSPQLHGQTILANVDVTNVSCFGSADGSITLSPSGGTAPYSFNWSTGATTATISGLTAGPYAYTITDADGNTKADGISVLTPAPILANASATPVPGCLPGDVGSATVAPTGGTAPYTVEWSNGQTGTTIGSTTGGAFGYTITDAEGCSLEGGISILAQSPIIPQPAITNISCFGEGDGQATLNPFGGVPPYSYVWNTGATTATITDLVNGVYAYTITDAVGCQASGDFAINTPWPIIPRLETSDGPCEGAGSASLDPFEGTPPYTYEWSTGETTQSIDGLSEGTYSYTVTDANGCIADGEFEIGPQTQTITCQLVILTVPTQDDDNGRIRAIGSDGTGPYTYEWSDGQTGAIANGLTPGSYEVTITDAEGCSTVCGLALNASDCENITDAGEIGFDQTLCGPGNDPATLVSIEDASGGTGVLEYMWMFSTTFGPFGPTDWQPIPGTNSPSYNPGPIFETTYFVRCARRVGCPNFLEPDFITVTVGDDARADIVGDPIVCTASLNTYTAETVTPNASIGWSFTGPLSGVSVSGSSVVVQAGGTGLGSVTLTVTENGCTASRTLNVTVSDVPGICEWSLDGGGIANAFAEAFPNPTTGQVEIQLKETEMGSSTVSLYSTSGQQLSINVLQVGTTRFTLDLGQYPSGLYFLEVATPGRPNTILKVQRL